MRAFIGIDFGDDLKQEIAAIQDRLKAESTSGNWKNPASFHLTLKFLGEIDDGQLAEIDDILKRLASNQALFELAVSGLWTFDGKDSIRVLWLGFSGDLVELRSMQGRLDEALEPIGFPPEKRGFAPHVTLGQDITFQPDFQTVQERLGEIALDKRPVREIVLFESVPEGGQRAYRRVYTYPLA
jgi:2'-5' RNA ligase